MEYKTDIDIAQSCQMKPITEIAATAHVEEQYLEQYGKYKAKVDPALLKNTDRCDGKLILVTAITPTPAGEGKTTTTIGLADGLRRIGTSEAVLIEAPGTGMSESYFKVEVPRDIPQGTLCELSLTALDSSCMMKACKKK